MKRSTALPAILAFMLAILGLSFVSNNDSAPQAKSVTNETATNNFAQFYEHPKLLPLGTSVNFKGHTRAVISDYLNCRDNSGNPNFAYLVEIDFRKIHVANPGEVTQDSPILGLYDPALRHKWHVQHNNCGTRM